MSWAPENLIATLAYTFTDLHVSNEAAKLITFKFAFLYRRPGWEEYTGSQVAYTSIAKYSLCRFTNT